MGLQDHLVGITFECPELALREKPIVVRCGLEGTNFSSSQIDTIFSESKNQGTQLYHVDQQLLEDLAPDIIFTQDVCEVCLIDTACAEEAVSNFDKPPELIPINPQSLEDVFESAMIIAKALGKPQAALNHLAFLNDRIERVIDLIEMHRLLPRRTMLMEWIDPIFNCGHWIPDQITIAGGVDKLSNPSGDSIRIPWEEIQQYNPEVLIIAPCGFTVSRTLKEIELLSQKPGWSQLKAVQNDEVYIADFELFTQSSASTLVSGIELLAGLFHPKIIPIPEQLKQKFSSLDRHTAHF